MLNSTESPIYCHCKPLHQCPNANPTCVSSTGCFHSLLLDKSLTYVVEEHLGCFPNHTNQVDLHCREPPLVNPLVYCCSAPDGNYCNSNLAPHLPRSRIASMFSLQDTRMLVVALLLPLGTLLCGLIAIGLFWQCVLRKRLKRERFPSTYYHSAYFFNKKSKSPKLFGKSSIGHESETEFNHRDEKYPLATVEKSKEFISGTSGSGSGVPFLVQRTIARHVQLEMCIGKGRFGEVWRAIFQGEPVAVKIFSSRDESSWARETEVYNAGILHHPNILAYYASDMISRGGCTQLWLITAYHQNGSLHDFLSHSVVSLSDGLRLARSVAAGLAFLHTEIQGCQYKPAIVHRDIKSKNVLVRDDKEACLADLGLALLQPKVAITVSDQSHFSSLVYEATSGATESYNLGFSSPSSPGALQPAGPRVGTKRYMAPELLMAVNPLEHSSNLYSEPSLELSEGNLVSETMGYYLPFEVYQAADVYAMALVFWEILRCTQGSDKNLPVEGYQIPYQDMVPTDPTFSQMRTVVCGVSSETADESTTPGCESTEPTDDVMRDTRLLSHGSRPPISDRWIADPFLCRAAQLVQECWNWSWSSRLPALRVRKNLEALEASTMDISTT